MLHAIVEVVLFTNEDLRIYNSPNSSRIIL
jgi:hypothetical protein